MYADFGRRAPACCLLPKMGCKESLQLCNTHVATHPLRMACASWQRLMPRKPPEEAMNHPPAAMPRVARPKSLKQIVACLFCSFQDPAFWFLALPLFWPKCLPCLLSASPILRSPQEALDSVLRGSSPELVWWLYYRCTLPPASPRTGVRAAAGGSTTSRRSAQKETRGGGTGEPKEGRGFARR